MSTKQASQFSEIQIDNPHSDPIQIYMSVVVPVYNEEESVRLLTEELRKSLSAIHPIYEIIFVNDCSSDRTVEFLDQLVFENPQIVRVIHLEQRKGQTQALKTGIEQAKGEYVITMDGDLQNDPADILKMWQKMQDGYSCVCGWRKNRRDTWLKARLSKFGNILQRLLTGTSIHDVSCTLRIYSREAALRIPLNWEGQHRFIPLSLSLQGFKIGEVVSHHRMRKFGKTKYSHKRIFKVMADFFKILKTKGKS